MYAKPEDEETSYGNKTMETITYAFEKHCYKGKFVMLEYTY